MKNVKPTRTPIFSAKHYPPLLNKNFFYRSNIIYIVKGIGSNYN